MRWSDRSGLTGPTIATNARTFWERKVAEDAPSYTQESDVWNNIYGTIRDRRRSRSRASSSSVTRSRTPSSVSSGRTTPSPGPQLKPSGRTMSEETLLTSPDLTSQSSSKYETACWLEARSVPVYYSSTILIQLGSTRKRYVEEIKFQKRLVPRRYAESMEMPTDIPNVCFTSEVKIPCEPPTFHIIDLEPQQRQARMENHLASNI